MVKSYKAALIYGVGDVRIEEVPWTYPDANEVLIEVKAASICPSDLREYRGIKQFSSPVRRGHEFAGVVSEVGKEVKQFKIGDRVTGLSWTPCYTCYNCRRGKFSACENRTQNMGAFAEYLTLQQQSVVLLPDNITFAQASCTEPLASVLKADQEISKVTLGDVVVVYGLGPMGCLHVQCSKLLGGRVIGIDMLEERRKLALNLGAELVIDPKKEDPVETVKKFASGRGADVVLVTVGGRAEPRCVETSLKMANFAGRINVYAGTYPDDIMAIDPNVIHYGELEVSGTKSYNPRTFNLALDLIATERINVEAIRYPIVSFDNIKQGFDLHGTDKAMKPGVAF